jgi:Ca2+-binding EF-hand superfamily protein
MRAQQLAFAVLVAAWAGSSTAYTAEQGRRQQQAGYRERDMQMRFQEMDTDGDGVITRAEWRGNAQAFREHDTNHDGVLSGDEVWMRRGRNGNRDTELNQRSFASLDRNNNGVITSGEWIGRAEDFRALDADGDGVITQWEYEQGRTVTQTPAYRAGRERGLADGRQAGREDKTINGGKWDLEGQRELETADAGYNSNLGARADYQAGYREGFRSGYREGFGPR